MENDNIDQVGAVVGRHNTDHVAYAPPHVLLLKVISKKARGSILVHLVARDNPRIHNLPFGNEMHCECSKVVTRQ